jgi:Ser/Thr protein kinase RdoA (MazF antagonist)
MKELIMRWKVMKLDLQRQVGLLMEGRLTTGTNNRDTTEETVERVGRMIDQLDSLLKEHDRPGSWSEIEERQAWADRVEIRAV